MLTACATDRLRHHFTESAIYGPVQRRQLTDTWEATEETEGTGDLLPTISAFYLFHAALQMTLVKVSHFSSNTTNTQITVAKLTMPQACTSRANTHEQSLMIAAQAFL